MTIWRMSCMDAGETMQQHVKFVFPEAEVAKRYERFYAGGFDGSFFGEPAVMAIQPTVQIENLEVCRLSEAGQHGHIGLKSSEDQAIEKQHGEFHSFQ